MAARKPLVIIGSQVQQLPTGDTLDAPTASPVELALTNAEVVAIVIGAPVYISANGSFQRARANASATARCIGLVATSPSIAAAGLGTVALSGPLVATTVQWDAVSGQSGGLTAGSQYFLDAATAGRVTITAPSAAGQFVAPLGTAIDATTMMITIDPTLLL